jgi:hypothetical protein
MIVAASRRELVPPLAVRFNGAAGRRVLGLLGLGMVLFGLAELPALVTMSAHGTGVLGFERAGTTRRLNEILFVWGPPGRKAAEAHVLIDLGFIACYGLLLTGMCVRLWRLYRVSGYPRVAQIAAGLAWAALIAATVNALQKLALWLELHGHTAQPLPALASLCAAMTSILAIAALLFSITGVLAARLLRIRGAPNHGLGEPEGPALR